MYKYSQLKTVHLEVTSKCNVSCPMCLRNVSGGKTNPLLPLTELTLSDIKNIFSVSFIKQLKRFYMCGNYGDPMVAKDTLEIFQYLRKHNSSLHLSLFTNGSGRVPSWWERLARVVNLVHFSIDGLKDTNHLYRRGAVFHKIMESAEAYIKAGGTAVWDYIVFRHNEHQVEVARELANTMGFYKFVVKKTGRFFSNTRSQVKDNQPVLNKKGEVEYFLEMPENPLFKNSSLQREREIILKHGSLYEHFNQTPIACKVAEEKSLYISAEGYVFPCCWLANQLYPWYLKKRSSQVWLFIDRLPEKEQSLNAKKRPLKDIVEDVFFQKSVPESWLGKDIKKDKLRVCAKTCGKTFDPFGDQFK